MRTAEVSTNRISESQELYFVPRFENMLHRFRRIFLFWLVPSIRSETGLLNGEEDSLPS